MTPVHARFIDKPITAVFGSDHSLKKTPECPVSFHWRETTFEIEKIISEWKDFSRHGRFSRNMKPAHADRAAVRGSMGVGRFYFRVLTSGGRVFDLYFDRSRYDKKKGISGWVLFREII